MLDMAAYDGVIVTLELVAAIDAVAGMVCPEDKVLEYSHVERMAHNLLARGKRSITSHK